MYLVAIVVLPRISNFSLHRAYIEVISLIKTVSDHELSKISMFHMKCQNFRLITDEFHNFRYEHLWNHDFYAQESNIIVDIFDIFFDIFSILFRYFFDVFDVFFRYFFFD